MAKHVKKKPIPRGVIAGSIATAAVAVIAVVCVVLTQTGVIASLAGLFRKPDLVESSSLPPADSSSAPGASEPEPDPEPVFRRPDTLSGVRLTAGVDYMTGSKLDGQTVRQQIDAALDAVKDWNFNTLLLPVAAGGKVFFDTAAMDKTALQDADGTDFDPLAYLLESARAAGLYVYGVLDLRVGEGWDPARAEDTEKMRTLAADAAAQYAFDGWLIEGYGYPLRVQADEEAFAAAGNGRTMAQFMEDSVTAAVRGAVSALRGENRARYVGLFASAVWAHKRVDERGSATDGIYEDYTDGRANTLAWLDEDLFDFVMVNDNLSTSHATATFGAVLDWWSAICTARSLPYYVCHAVDRVAAKEAGWGGDQIAEQYLACKQAAGWGGSAYSSLAALQANTDEFADVLRKALDGTLDSAYRFEELTFSYPTSREVTVEESKFQFLGSTDPNIPVTMNGQKLELTERGGFAVDVTLQPGKNTYTFVSGGKTVTYTITYKVVVLKSVSPTGGITLDGGSTIGVSAIARKGATVKVSFNGSTVTMAAQPLKENEGADDPELSDFQNYTGSFKLPAGKVGQAQNLGAATVSASYNGLSASQKTGVVTVKALPEADAPEVVLPGVVKDMTPINPNTGGEVLETGDVIIVNKDYIETFDGATLEDWSRPTNAYFPKGTTDVIKNTVSLGNTKYYLLGCGRRVYASDVATYVENGKITANTLDNEIVEVNANHTILKLDSTWRIPYNLQLLPQKYQDAPGTPSKQPSYSINQYGQTTQYIDITFSYTTKVPAAAPDMSGSPLFSKAEWRDGGNNTVVLRLTLRQTGQFYGYSVVWDNDGTLQFSFKHPHGIAKNSSATPLKGVRIVVDPGHGGNSSGTYGTIKGLYEKTLTLTYANILKNKLQALGATVVMTRTTDVNPDNPDMSSRTAYARNNGTDLLLSVHMNGYSKQSAAGCSLHYFNEYSYAVTRSMTDAMRQVEGAYTKNYKEEEFKKRSEPCAWSPLFLCRVHDCPAVLIEYGFMTNPINMDLLINTTYQDKIVQATVDGVLKYFQSLPTYTVTPSTTATTPPKSTTSTTSTSTASTTAAPTTAAPVDSGAQAASSEARRDESEED